MTRKTIILGLLLVLLFPFPFGKLSAQSDISKLELGGFYSLMSSRYTDSGFGGRFGYNLSEMFAVETDYAFFPQDRPYFGKKGLALFGVKFGPRSESAGFFTRISPGFVRYDNAINDSCLGIQFPPPSCFGTRLQFALNVGGGFEIFPSRNTYFRFDIGNLWVNDVGGNTNNLLMNAGFGFRF